MGTKNHPGAYDCYAAAHPDEPMFVLLGRDGMAPSLVEAWANARSLDGEDAAKVAEARQCAQAMREWLQLRLGKSERPIGLSHLLIGALAGGECSTCGFRYFEHHGHIIPCPRCEAERLDKLIKSPEVADFLNGVRLEVAYQVERWGEPHDRSKSAEHWFWLVGYLAGKALRAAITGDRTKALHHTISSAAALFNWHRAIERDTSGAGIGKDTDLSPDA
jgi:uncharacterized Zn finger protein (UPF0148 family)